uniref:Lnkn-1 n=1 Tax=Pristionchus pacificus TaxID=54126 RepID=A0A2A6CHH0_PRIPA|eukprot:PDM77675.1 lnkn-1 [Pristionchus pacificus]
MEVVVAAIMVTRETRGPLELGTVSSVMSEMEATQQRVKSAVDSMLLEVDKGYLREMQKKMFNCSAKCCDDRKGPRESVEQCIEKCNEPMRKAQRVLEGELEQLQSSLSRCAMVAYDKLVSEFGPNQNSYTPDQTAAFTTRLEKMVAVCADDHVKQLPTIKSRSDISHAMIVRWLIRVAVLLLATVATVARASLLDEVDPWQMLNRRNITEKTGAVCAYADFNNDRYTDVVHYHGGKLVVLFQGPKDFLLEKDEANGKVRLSVDVGEYAEVACSVGDINGDGFPDIVASVRTTKGKGPWHLRYFTSFRAGEYEKDYKWSWEEVLVVPQKTSKHQIALIDITGDGIHDLIGMQSDGSNLLCLRGAEAKDGPTLTEACESLFANFTGELHPLMPALFGDVDGDRYAELVMMKLESGGGMRPEVWSRSQEGREWSWVALPEKQLPPPPNVGFAHTLAPLLSDIDMDEQMNFVVPVCKDATCTTLDSLQSTQWKMNEGKWSGWDTITIDLGQGNVIVAEEDTLVRMKAGDANLDGYPDMLVTIGTVNGPNNYAAVIENRGMADSNMRKFEKPSGMMIMPGLALGMIQSSSFFDFAEDGYLDVLVQWKLRDGDDWQWSMCISEPREQGDVTFLKVQTFTPLPKDQDIKNGRDEELDNQSKSNQSKREFSSVVWGGVCVTYEMETTGIGAKRSAIECQMPGNSHKAGLSPPFALFGLGRSPNFIDRALIGVPFASKIERLIFHEQKQIVPNARLMVQPPRFDDGSNGVWTLRLYLTPSTLIYSSLIVMASTCTILLVVVLILHFREKKVDRVERAAQSHRFHFDAM